MLPACGSDTASQTVVVTTELHQRWTSLPHRISRMEITSSLSEDGSAAQVLAENDGGAAGSFDRANVRVGLDRWSGSSLRSVEGSVTVVIPPHDSTMPTLHRASAVATLTDAELAGADTLIAFIRGYRIDTNLYETAPDFESRIPYDPTFGFTTQGLGIQLAAPSASGDTITFDVDVRNSLGPADRPDMNEAMDEATTWMRVDYVVVGAFGESQRTRAEAEYNLSYATFGQQTEHAHAPAADQAVELAGTPGLPHGMTGLTGFDFWLNVPGHQDPSCVEIHSNDTSVSGPGRYVTELSVRLWDRAYDPATGAASANVDMMLSNSSTFVEVGNLCLGLRGEVGLLQFGGSANVTPLVSDLVQLPRGGTAMFDVLLHAAAE